MKEDLILASSAGGAMAPIPESYLVKLPALESLFPQALSFLDNGCLWLGILFIIGAGICSRVYIRFQMQQKMAGAGVENHQAIPAIFYETPQLPIFPEREGPAVENAQADPLPDEPEAEWETFAPFLQMDRLS